MALPGVVYKFYLQAANREIYLSWNPTVGATSYDIQRSLDGVIFTSLATPVVSNYLDEAVTIGTMYYYKVAAVNGTGTGPYTAVQKAVPAPASEMSLLQLRTMVLQRADTVNNEFITLPEINSFINLARYELYDLLITADEEYFVAPPIQFTAIPAQSLYPLPDGELVFTNGNTGDTNYVAPPFYKFKGQDLSINTTDTAFATINKFNFQDRNQFLFPNSSSGAYGVFNLRYRLQGSNVKFIPTPSSGQLLQMWYIPRLNEMVADTDLTTEGVSGWLNYVIVRAAKYIIDKQELPTQALDQELLFLKSRIEETAANRDTGQPDTISNVRMNPYKNGGFGNGFQGGW